MGVAQASNLQDESDIALKAVSRWGMCLLETQDEASVKAQVFSVVQLIDNKFQAKHGVKATTLARTKYGENFVEHFYNTAREHHATLPANHADMCRSLGNRVVTLSR
jgi:hypothetical protein